MESLTHGWIGLVVAYLVVGVPMTLGMLRRRVAVERLLRAPLLALAVSLAAALAWRLTLSATFRSGAAAHGIWAEAAGLLFLAAFGYAAGLLLGPVRARTTHKRGTVVEEGRKARVLAGQVSVAGIPVPMLDETKHFKFIGTTGTGKSTAIRELLQGALARGDRVVIADPDCGYLNRFYDSAAGDLILNPFDPRSQRWDLFREVEQGYDVDQLARALIPDQEGSDRTWRGYARTFLTAVARELWELGRRDSALREVGELYRLISAASADELRILVKNTPAQPFLETGNERMFGSVRSVASSNVAAFAHIAEQSAPPLSVRRWIREGRGRALFLPYSAGQISALRSLISAWMRLAIFETMTAEEKDRRIWFIIDELDALGAIDGLKDALARLRKFGGRCVLGFQSIAQVRGTQGETEAQTIVENCGNTLILRCSAGERGGTAEFASRLIGRREVVRTQVSSSKRTGWIGTAHKTQTVSDHHITEDAVLASEIEQLPDLAGFLKLASSPEWRRVRVVLS